jgi:hypothetical protein
MTRGEIDKRLLRTITKLRADGARDDDLCRALAGQLFKIKADEYRSPPKSRAMKKDHPQ